MLERVELEQVSLDRVELGEVDDSPLADIAYTGNIESDAAAELDVAIVALQTTRKEAQRNIAKALDSEYWVCLCFQSRDQVEEFLANCGHPDPTQKYVDGVRLADRIGRPVTPDKKPFYTQRKKANLAAMARPIKPNKGELNERKIE